MRISDWSSDVCSSDLHKPKDHGPAVHKNCGTAAACRRYRRMNGIVGHIGSGRDYPLQGPMMKDKVKRQTSSPSNPPWAEGLKRIYSSVLEEPLPEAFEKLLEKLDKADDDSTDRQITRLNS